MLKFTLTIPVVIITFVAGKQRGASGHCESAIPVMIQAATPVMVPLAVMRIALPRMRPTPLPLPFTSPIPLTILVMVAFVSIPSVPSFCTFFPWVRLAFRVHSGFSSRLISGLLSGLPSETAGLFSTRSAFLFF